MIDSLKLDNTYRKWIEELKNKVRSAQAKAAIAVNSELIVLYWELGKRLAEKQTAYGTGFIPQVSKDLKGEFPKMKGFSERNLAFCRQFHLFYSSSNLQQPVANSTHLLPKQKSQQAVDQIQNTDSKYVIILKQLVAQIPWGHNILIFTKSENIEIALFYIQQTVENQWSRATLKDKIKSELHKRKGKATSNFSTTLPKSMSALAQETLKDPYVFDFLTLDTEYREKDIENQLIYQWKMGGIRTLPYGHVFTGFVGRDFGG